MLEGSQSPSRNNISASSDLPGPNPHQMPSHGLSHLPGLESSRVPRTAEDDSSFGRPLKKRRTAALHNLPQIGKNMAKFGRGIFKAPYPNQRAPAATTFPSGLPDLPPKEVADRLLRQYRYTIHPTLPTVHWPAFYKQYEGVYAQGSLENVPRIWSALLFGVFACGTLHRSWSDGQQYLDISRSLIDLWAEDLTLDYARAALLNCMFLVESNRKSAGWNWIGFAVRVAFDIGLNCEAGTWDPIEEEMRRRVWWCIYACDW